MRRSMWMISGALLLRTLVLPGPTAAADPAAPTPVAALRRTLEAAGGMDALRRLAVVKLVVDREEITLDGKHTQTQSIFHVRLPGPVPGRLEIPSAKVIAGDDGTGGWAQVGGVADTRANTPLMIKRLITTDLFPLLLPFSLTWDGVTVNAVRPGTIDGKQVWQLRVETSRTFFHTPQIANEWLVSVDRETFELVRAESPFTDLGRGIVADGMRISWPTTQTVEGVRLPGVLRVIGLDAAGHENAHTRSDRVTVSRAKPEGATALFANPSPSTQPQLPVLQPPPGLGKGQA